MPTKCKCKSPVWRPDEILAGHKYNVMYKVVLVGPMLVCDRCGFHGIVYMLVKLRFTSSGIKESEPIPYCVHCDNNCSM